MKDPVYVSVNLETLQLANDVKAFVVAAGICELLNGTEYIKGKLPAIVERLYLGIS